MVVNNLEGNNNKWNKANNNDTNYDRDHNNEKKRKKQKINQELLRGLIFIRRRRLSSFHEEFNLHEATDFIFIS